MTGFGRSELRSARGFIRVEIKTTNHKFLEVSSRVPNHLAELEDTLRKTVSKQLRRGKVNVFVSGPDPAVFSSRLFLNEPLAKEVFHKVRRLKHVLKLGEVSANPVAERALFLKEVLHYPDVLVKDTSAVKSTLFFKDLEKAVTQALFKLGQSRAREGRALKRDLERRVSEIRRSLKRVERRLPALSREYRKALRQKAGEFLKDGEIDRDRLTLEV
ncbi:MAG: hypothetical protein HYZ87_02980, partial [Candidatus Omnitrophica bacterium]|nr:hypothetical protein [Candidatus Omnitrophota bacterium]